MLEARRLFRSRRETAFSPESAAGSSEFRSQIQWKSFLRFEGEAQIVGGVLELVMSKVREETGRLSPSQSVTAFRLSSMVIGRRSWLLSGNLVFLGFDQNNCSLNSFTH